MEKAGRQQGDLVEKKERSRACRLPAFLIIPTERERVLIKKES